MELKNQTKGKIWVNGEIIEWNDAKVHVLTHTLHYGTGAFEGIRSYNKKIFKAKEHYERLRFSSSKVGIDIKYSDDELIDITNNLLEINELKDTYIRPLTYKGAESTRLNAKCSSNIMIACWELKNYFDKEKFEKGISVTFSKYKKISEKNYPVGTKLSGLYVLNLLARQDIGEFDDVIMTDENEFIAECSTSNIFYVKNNTIITPLPDCFLNGITRQTIIEIARKNDINVIEKKVTIDDLINGDEIFITGTAIEIMPITKIDSKIYKIGNITKYLIEAYREEVLK